MLYPPKSMLTPYRVAGITLFCDQLTKFLALRFLKPAASFPIFQNVFHLSFVENNGIAFGLFQGHPQVLTVVITASILCLLVCARFFSNQPQSHRLAYGFILGGSVGNWIDRIRFGHVIDFLDFRIWPVFNIADSFITIGVILFLWFALRGR